MSRHLPYMKSIAVTAMIIALMIVLPLRTAIAGDKPELKWRKFEAGFEEAKKTNKKILLDVYTDWCGWCKKLDKEVYANDKVADYLSQQYVVIKLNAESSARLRFDTTNFSEAELAQAFGITGYPTMVFFDSNGNPIDKVSGYMSADEFLPIAKYFGDDYYKTVSWQEYRKATPPPNKDKSGKKK